MRNPAHHTSTTVGRLAFALLASVCILPLAGTSFAQAKVRIAVDLDTQMMHVEGKDKSFDLKVSSGKPGYETPAGDFKVLWMDKDHHSDEYDGAFMPNAIFFAPGYAIHGFGRSPWGHKASHGCIRIPVAKSEVIFDMVKAEGGADITVTGASNAVVPTVASIRERNRQRQETAEAAYPDDDYAGPRTPTYAEPLAPSADRAYGAPSYDSLY